MAPPTGLLGAHRLRPVRPSGRSRTTPDDVATPPPADRFLTLGTLWEALVVAAMAWLLVAVFLAGWSLLPMLAGWRPVVITSGSMTPALRPGDVVLVDPDATGIRPGHVVYVKPLRPGASPITHRVVRIEADGDLVTRGDANRVDDSTPVPPDRVGGIARLAIPNAGRIALAWLRRDPADLAWLGVTSLAVLVVAASLWRRDEEEESVRDDDERLVEVESHPFFGDVPPEEADPGTPLAAHAGAHHGTASHARGADRLDEGRTSDGISYDLGLGYPTDSVFVPRPRVPALPERLVPSDDLLPPPAPDLPEPPRERFDLPVLRLLPASLDRKASLIGIRERWTYAFVPLQRGTPSGRHITAGRR